MALPGLGSGVGANAGRIKKNARAKKRNYSSYKNAIHKVLKQVHPTMSISSKAMKIMDAFVNDALERVCEEAKTVIRTSKGATLDSRSVQCCVRLLLPGELARHASAQGSKAVATAFTKAK